MDITEDMIWRLAESIPHTAAPGPTLYEARIAAEWSVDFQDAGCWTREHAQKLSAWLMADPRNAELLHWQETFDIRLRTLRVGPLH